MSWEWCTGRAAANKGEITGVLLAIVRAASPGQVVGAAPCGGVLRDLHDHRRFPAFASAPPAGRASYDGGGELT